MNERVEAIRRQRAECKAQPGPIGEVWTGYDVDCLLAALAQVELEREEMVQTCTRVACELRDERNAARAEVERLKEELTVFREKIAIADEAYLQAEADLARVRAALDGTHFHHKAFEPECSHCQAQRAALEGRG